MYPIDEIYVFLVCIYAGILISIIYDLYRGIKLNFYRKRIITYTTDFIFWAVVSFVSFFMIHKANAFDLRYYNFTGVIIGILVYFNSISKYVLLFFIKITRIIISIFVNIYYLIIYPTHIIFDMIFYRHYKKAFKKISKLERK